MRFDIITLFPEMVSHLATYGVIGRAVRCKKVTIDAVDLRQFGEGSHLTTDDRPFGGGDGMVMKPGPLLGALRSIEREEFGSRVILLTPQGTVLNQAMARNLAAASSLSS